MISFNSSDWLIPITQCYFYIIYIWAYNSGMQIEDLDPFNSFCPWRGGGMHGKGRMHGEGEFVCGKGGMYGEGGMHGRGLHG